MTEQFTKEDAKKALKTLAGFGKEQGKIYGAKLNEKLGSLKNKMHKASDNEADALYNQTENQENENALDALFKLKFFNAIDQGKLLDFIEDNVDELADFDWALLFPKDGGFIKPFGSKEYKLGEIEFEIFRLSTGTSSVDVMHVFSGDLDDDVIPLVILRTDTEMMLLDALKKFNDEHLEFKDDDSIDLSAILSEDNVMVL